MVRNLLIMFLLMLSASLLSCGSKDEAPTDVAVMDTIPTLVTQVQQCARLYTTEYKIHKIITHDDVMRLKGSLLNQHFDIPLPLGERRIAIPMDATLKAYIDFSSFAARNVERQGEHITLLLPDPQVVMTSSRIDRKSIREYVGLTRSHFTDKELTDYERQGRLAILNSVANMGIVEQARANAARVLVPMLVEMGFKEENIVIAFRKDLDLMRIFRMDN